MPTELRRMTFAVTEDMESMLSRAKKDLFYDRTQSDMIRELVMAGLDAIDEKAANENTLRIPSDLDYKAFIQAQKEEVSKNQLIKKAITIYLNLGISNPKLNDVAQNKENVNC